MGVKYSNNASTSLPGGISDSATSITVVDASSFPAISSPNYAYLTLVSATALEVVKCTDITGNVLTVIREQEDTDASAFVTDDRVELRVTTAMLTDALAETVAAAAASAAAAATSETNAAASYDNFDDRWLGSKSSDPSVDNDGATLLDGAAYYNTTTDKLMVYDLGGTTWNGTTPSSAEQTAINAVNAIASDVTAVAADATDIGAVAAKATEIGRLGTAAAVEDMSILGTAAIVTDMSILGTAAVVEDMSILGTADIVTDMSILATSDIVTDMSILATPDIVTDMSILGSAAIVEDMSILGSAAVVEDMSILATSDIVTDMSILATPDIVTDMSILATPAIVTDMSILGTAAIVEDMSILGTAAVVEDISILGTAAVVEDLSILGTAAVVEDLSILATPAIVEDLSILGTAAIVEDLSILGTSAIVDDLETCSDNLVGINNFAARYRTGSSDPDSELDEGDLAYNSTANVLKYYNGSSWITIVAGSLTDVVQDGSPQLGAQLDVNGYGLGDGTLELLKFSETGSAVNEFTIANAAAGNGPTLSATGTETDVDINVTPKGDGDLILDGLKYPRADGDAGQFLKTNGSAQLSFETIQGGDLSTEGSAFANYNTITDDATTTTVSTKNMFLMGDISVADTKTWTIAGNGALTIL